MNCGLGGGHGGQKEVAHGLPQKLAAGYWGIIGATMPKDEPGSIPKDDPMFGSIGGTIPKDPMLMGIGGTIPKDPVLMGIGGSIPKDPMLIGMG